MQLIRAHKERIKILFIALLSVSAVLLAFHTGLFGAPIQAGGARSEQVATRPWDRDGHIQAAARPGAAMASLGDGAFRGHLLEPAILYDLLSGHLGEALASVGASAPVTRVEWEHALTNPGVFFRYDVALPAAVLAAWLGAQAEDTDAHIASLFLSAGQDTVYLYYMDQDGTAHRSTTAVRAEALHDVLAVLTPNGAQFGFLDPAYTGSNPDTILLADYGGLPTLESHNAVSGVYAQQLAFLDALGLNPALVRQLDEGGTRTIVEGGTTLIIHENGLMNYHCRSEHPRLVVNEAGLGGAIQIAQGIVQVLELTSEAASVQLTDWHYEQGQFVLTFGYYFGGLPIWTERPAATVVISEHAVTEVTLFARAFLETGQTVSVMPEIQAAAAAGNTPLRLSFAAIDETDDSAAITLHPRWLFAEVRHG